MIVIPLLAAPAAAQVPNQAATRVVVPAPPASAVAQPPPAASVPATVVPQASVPVDPATEMKARYVGELPPVELTLVYPPVEGQQFVLETHNLAKGEDGYYSPTSEANSFVMTIPHPAKGVPVSLTCAVKGKPRAVGSLHWVYSNDAPGGGVDFRFRPGETETRYQTSPANPYPFPMKTMWVTLPLETGIKECRVSGTFIRPPIEPLTRSGTGARQARRCDGPMELFRAIRSRSGRGGRVLVSLPRRLSVAWRGDR